MTNDGSTLQPASAKKTLRPNWQTPELRKMRAGSADNAFPGNADGAFTQS